MKVLNLEGLASYTEILLNKIKVMLNEKADKNHTHDFVATDADTVDGCHASEFQKAMDFPPINTNVLEYAENYPTTNVNGTFFTCRIFNGYNEPNAAEGVVGSGDYYYCMHKIDNSWITILAIDVRSWNMYIINKHSGTWGVWRNISDGGNANTAKNASGNVFQIYKDTASITEGGELQLQNQDGTFWNVDTVNNDFRIFDSTGKVHLRLDKSNSGNDYFIGNAASANNSDTVDGYHSYDFCHTAFSPSTNMNEITTSGAYRINSGNTNAPSGSDWGQLFVVHGGGDTIAQLIFDFSQGRCWLRTGNPSECGGAGKWTDWRTLYTSENITYGTHELTPGSSSLATGNFYYQYE